MSGVSTLCPGFVLRVRKNLSKADIVSICEEIGDNAGGEWEPLPGRMMGVRCVDEGWRGLSMKEMRVPRRCLQGFKTMSRKANAKPVFWPEGGSKNGWRNDVFPAVLVGHYATEFLAVGDAPVWTRREVDVVRDAFVKMGVRVGKSKQVNRMNCRKCERLRKKAGMDDDYFEDDDNET